MFKTIRCIVLSLFLTVSQSVYAQYTPVTIKVIEEETNALSIGAVIHFKDLDLETNTNEKGLAVFEKVPLGNQRITISYVGFETIEDTVQITQSMPIKTYFIKGTNHALEGITIKTTRSTRTIKRIPTRIEFIGGEELEEKFVMNASNISMVLRESTGIQIQQTSLSSVNSSIRIQGLDGRYTQILKDGFPLFGGFSGGLSINQIPPLDLSQFEIIKGSSSTLYGGGAIAGLVNLVSKTPEKEPALDLQFSQTHVGGSTTNLFYSKRTQKFGYTMYGSGHYQNIYDPDGDDFSNLPETKTISFNPKLFYYPSDKTTFWLGINGMYDQRKGGDITSIKNGTNGIHRYSEENTSTRLNAQAVYEQNINNSKFLQVKSSLSYFDRQLLTPDILFSGRQWDFFSEINYTVEKKKTDWILGGNLYNNSFTEKNNPKPRNQNNMTLGLFVNNTTDFSEKMILETGLRTDYLPNWGVFPLPRISLLWKANTQFSSRIGGGLGYKIPDMFTEEATTLNFKNVLPIDKDNLTAERSYGGNIDFNLSGNIFDEIGYSINQLFYITSINNTLLLEEQTDKTYIFKNAEKEVLSRGSETNVKFTYNDFRWFLNYAFISTTLNYLPNNPQKTLTPIHQAGCVLMYENKEWRIGYELYYTGSQILSTGANTTDFFTTGLLVQKHFAWGSPYMNFENMTDRRQSRFSPETLPPHQDPQFTEIYAPTDGFVFTIGVIVKPFGNESEH